MQNIKRNYTIVSNTSKLEPLEIDHLLENVCMKSYLHTLSEQYVVPFVDGQSVDMNWYKITKIVYEKDIFFVDKLSMLYTSLHQIANNIALVVQKENNGVINLYLGACDKKSESNKRISKIILHDGLKGCLPGIELNAHKEINWDFSDPNVASVSGIASLRDDKKEKFVQGVERLLNATSSIPHFTAIFLADAISLDEQYSIRNAYETIYSQLVPLSENQLTYTEGTSKSISETITDGITKTIGESISRTITSGTSTNESSTNTRGTSKNSSYSVAPGAMIGAAIGAVGGPVGIALGATLGAMSGLSFSSSSGTNTSSSRQTGTGTSNSESDQSGTNRSSATSNSKAKGTSEQDTVSYGNQIKFENKTVKELLARIDKQLERMKSSEGFGLWNTATYFVSNSYSTSVKLASIYKGIITGQNSGLESASVNGWEHNSVSNKQMLKYIQNYRHPIFKLSETLKVTAGSMINSEELAIHLSLPQSSVPGILVKEQTPFGRNVISDIDSNIGIDLGNIIHLDTVEDKNKVKLDIETLSKHTFITGTTGSGKSNVIYLLLSQLKESGKKFLVIESAKGEYKNVFGGDKDVNVFGTNPNFTPLLRINPFAFPSEIHVYEHIDRLVEIFNVCWPMYAAMPAVLKASIEKAYENCGWDLINSYSDSNLFPSFEDVCDSLKEIINGSEYSSDTKGDYKGALETRLRSLTNGIVGQLFTGNYIDDERLFNNNTIIDLSRVGSSETKSMIMGMLILKLNEFRMSENRGMNQPLRHVTVLEEAHNLLKRTSSEQSQESSNLAGKSVEMIANSIAEMRTYGEGFIIADQSPSMLDMSAIRNTNTKIIMSLPDKDDRTVVGKAAGLTDEQIDEISKLKTGVGVIYQNNWAESVLCKINYYPCSNYNYQCVSEVIKSIDNRRYNTILMQLLLKNRNQESDKIDINFLESNIHTYHTSIALKSKILAYLKEYKETGELTLWNDFASLSKMVSSLLKNRTTVLSLIQRKESYEDLTADLFLELDKYIETNVADLFKLNICHCLIRDVVNLNIDSKGIYEAWISSVNNSKQLL